MRVALIGLGDIARKAYLPVLGARSDLELVLVSRDPAKLDEIANCYRVPRRFTGTAQAIADGLDAAFVHAATEAHPDIVEGLLKARVPVYVDKPLADSGPEAERLIALAEDRGVPFMVGFNRRFAPAYAALREHPRDVILMQKNRTASADYVRRVVFDDFIHVIDTLRFLAPGQPAQIGVEGKVRDGLLHHVVIRLSGPGWTAVGLMNRMSGANEESLDVMGEGRKRRVVNLSEVIDYGPGEVLRRRGDWTPVARERGIEQAVERFLDGLRSGQDFDIADALETHRLCERIVQALETA